MNYLFIQKLNLTQCYLAFIVWMNFDKFVTKWNWLCEQFSEELFFVHLRKKKMIYL